MDGAIRYGADWSKARPSQAMLAKYGITFACRYLLDDVRDRGKGIKAPELAGLTAWGIPVVANFEYATEPLLTAAQGTRDAKTAIAELAALGAPAHVPVYFSFDYDAPVAHFPGILDYLAGAGSVLGTGKYGEPRAGAYCKFAVAEFLAAHGVHWLWQTYAWSPKGAWSAHAVIRQVHNGAFAPDFDGDLDTTTAADFGQWLPGMGDDMIFTENLAPLGDLAKYLPADLHVTPSTVWSADYAIKLAVVAGQSARMGAADAKAMAAGALAAASACKDAIGVLAASGTGGAIDYDVLAGKVADLIAARLAS